MHIIFTLHLSFVCKMYKVLFAAFFFLVKPTQTSYLKKVGKVSVLLLSNIYTINQKFLAPLAKTVRWSVLPPALKAQFYFYVYCLEIIEVEDDLEDVNLETCLFAKGILHLAQQANVYMNQFWFSFQMFICVCGGQVTSNND